MKTITDMNYNKTLNRRHRLIAFISIAVIYTCLIPTILYGQKGLMDSDLRKSLNHMFQHIDKQSVPTGLLRDYAVEDEDLDLFSGDIGLNEANTGTLARYANLLNTIGSAALLKDLTKDIEKSLKSYDASEENGVLSLSFMLYQYARIKENALTDGLIRYENGQVYKYQKRRKPVPNCVCFCSVLFNDHNLSE